MKLVYAYMDMAEDAYLLKNGSVFFEIQPNERYKISGKNLIVGSAEVLLSLSGNLAFRCYNLYQDENSELAPIPSANLVKLIHQYNIGYNLNIFLAKMLHKTTEILGGRQEKLTREDKVSQQLAIRYYKLTKQVLDIGQQTRYPDIIALGNNLKSELVYETGRIFARENKAQTFTARQDTVEDFRDAITAGHYLCKQGDQGQEMYILDQGSLAVMVNENQVAEINEPGTIIGEIALLLGEKRTASLKALNNVTVTTVKKENVKEFHATNQDIFLHLGKNLSERIHNVFSLIHNLDAQIEKNAAAPKAKFMSKDKIEHKLTSLSEQIHDLYRKRRYLQMQDLISQLNDDIELT